MRFRGACRNDANNFLACVFCQSMDHQENGARRDGSNGDPAVLLVFSCMVRLRNGEGIVKNESGGFKTNIVLAEIAPVFVFVPNEAHGQSALFPSLLGRVTNVNTIVRTNWDDDAGIPGQQAKRARHVRPGGLAKAKRARHVVPLRVPIFL